MKITSPFLSQSIYYQIDQFNQNSANEKKFKLRLFHLAAFYLFARFYMAYKVLKNDREKSFLNVDYTLTNFYRAGVTDGNIYLMFSILGIFFVYIHYRTNHKYSDKLWFCLNELINENVQQFVAFNTKLSIQSNQFRNQKVKFLLDEYFKIIKLLLFDKTKINFSSVYKTKNFTFMSAAFRAKLVLYWICTEIFICTFSTFCKE